MGAQGQLTQGPNVPNPRTKYKRSKNVFAVTSIALIIGRDWPRLVQPLVQFRIVSPGTLDLEPDEEGTWTRPDYLVKRDVEKKEGPFGEFFLPKSRNSCRMNGRGCG